MPHDPKQYPQPGDMLRRDGYTRKVTQVNGSNVYYVRSLAEGGWGCTRGCWISTWHAWAVRAEVVSADKKLPSLTPKEARLLCDTHEVDQLFLDEEEHDCLAANNPELLAAYTKLREIAQS